MTSLVWADCACGARALATPERAQEALCASCHWVRAQSATVPDTQPVSLPEVVRTVDVIQPSFTSAEPARLVDVDVRSPGLMEKAAREAGWQVRTHGTYGNGTEMIGVWVDGYGFRGAAFWERAYGDEKWAVSGTLVRGRPPFTFMNHTEFRAWLRGQGRPIYALQKAWLRRMPVHTCEPPDKKVFRKKAAEHGG